MQRTAARESEQRPASLVVQTSFLGDTVLTTPLIAELARQGPVDVVVTPAAAPLLANNPAVRDVLVYDKRGALAGLAGLGRAAALVRRRRTAEGRAEPRRVAAAYLAQGSVRSAALAALGGVSERVGFTTSAGRALYTRRVLYRDDLHHAERLWQLAAGDASLRAEPGRLRPRLYPGAAEVRAVDRLLGEAEYAGEPIVALAPGSVWPTKRWPYYSELALRLVSQARIAFIGSAADRAQIEPIRRAVGVTRPIDAAGRLSLLGAAELIGRAALLVTNDSAPQHLASAMNTPTVAIFGPTVPAFGFGPLATTQAIAGHDALACRPCDRHGPRRCPLGHWRCMRDLTVERVEALVADLVSSRAL